MPEEKKNRTEKKKKNLTRKFKKLTRADDGPRRQLRQRRHARSADQCVAHVLAGEVARQDRALRQVGGHVLHGVDGDVDAAVEQRVVDLLREKPLATDVGQGLAEDLVSRGLDDADLEGALLGEVRERGLQIFFFFILWGGCRMDFSRG